MTDTARLEKAISDSGLKKGYLAEKLGISAYALSLKINNVREFKASEIEILCRSLDIDVPERMRIFFAT